MESKNWFVHFISDMKWFCFCNGMISWGLLEKMGCCQHRVYRWQGSQVQESQNGVF